MAASTARLVVGSAAIGVALFSLVRRLLRARNRSRYDGLDGVVSFSARLIAAARAIESLRHDALFVDPLANILAGRKAMAKHQSFEEADTTAPRVAALTSLAPPATATAPQPAPPAQQQQQRLVPRLVLRTCFFDDATLLATGRAQPRAAAILQPVVEYLQQHPQVNPCRQVVMLGAGMDTRPWRLALPPGTRWFELDRQDVLAAKQRAMAAAGAAFQGADRAASTGSKPHSSSSGRAYPLLASAWSCASADLQQPGWAAKLLGAGLDTAQPIAWAAEGLLYYLEPDTVGPMLQEAADMSASGSFIVTNFMTEEGLALLRKPKQPPPQQRQRQQQDGASTAAATSTSTSTGSSTDAAQGSAAARYEPPRDLQKVGLMAHFKFGCPDDCEEFFAANGWQLLVRHSWQQAALKYGWLPQLTAAGQHRTHTQEVQLVVGVVRK